MRTLTADNLTTHLVDTFGPDASKKIAPRGRALVTHLLATWVMTAKACYKKGLLEKAPIQAFEQANSLMPASLRPITPHDVHKLLDSHEDLDEGIAALLELTSTFLEETIKWLEETTPGRQLLEELCRHWRDEMRTRGQQWAQSL